MKDAVEIKALLIARIEALARELHPEGSRNGAYWMCRSSQHAVKTGGKWIRLAGEKAGGWRDEVADTQGDVLQLIGSHYGWDSKREFTKILDWSRGFLGLGGMSAEERQRQARAVVAQQREAEAGSADKLAQDRKRAFGLYVRAKARPFVGSPADVYLKGRGIDVQRLGRMPGCLGYLPPYQSKRDGRWSYGSMLAGFTSADEKIVSIHRTFLTEAGEKAPIEAVRKMWPAMGGAAIRLWRGDSRMSPGEAAAVGLREALVLVEGVEDGLSVALARPDLRIWCAGSLGNLAAITLPECCDEIIVCADNDWGKQQAARQLEKAVLALARQSRPVSVVRSFVGKDMNDALQAGQVASERGDERG